MLGFSCSYLQRKPNLYTNYAHKAFAFQTADINETSNIFWV